MNLFRFSQFQTKFFAFALGSLAIVLSGQPAEIDAATTSVVSVYVDGDKQSVTTDAQTVGEVLDRAEIEIDEHDIVEPALDAEVTNHVFNINVYRALPVLLVDGEDEHRIKSAYGSARLIAENSGVVELHEEDHVSGRLVEDFLSVGHVGYRVEIARAVPVELAMGEKMTTVRTHATTVGGMFEELDIEIGNNDIIEPEIDAAIEEGMSVSLVQVGFESVTEEEEIDFAIETIRDNNRPIGYEEVESTGTPGLALVTYEIEYRNGEEVDRREIRRVVERNPESRFVVVGNRSNYNTGDNRQFGQEMAAARGWSGSEWSCLDTLWSRESGWRHTVSNYEGSGAYGIPQALPGSKMASHGSDWRTNPRTQIAWGLDYIANRYSTPCGAYSFFQANNWY